MSFCCETMRFVMQYSLIPPVSHRSGVKAGTSLNAVPWNAGAIQIGVQDGCAIKSITNKIQYNEYVLKMN